MCSHLLPHLSQSTSFCFFLKKIPPWMPQALTFFPYSTMTFPYLKTIHCIHISCYFTITPVIANFAHRPQFQCSRRLDCCALPHASQNHHAVPPPSSSLPIVPKKQQSPSLLASLNAPADISSCCGFFPVMSHALIGFFFPQWQKSTKIHSCPLPLTTAFSFLPTLSLLLPWP